MSGEVVSLTTRRVRAARPAPVHPLVLRWRRQADDIYTPAPTRSALRACARELEQHERGELGGTYDEDL